MVFTEDTGKNVVINSWEEYARFNNEKIKLLADSNEQQINYCNSAAPTELKNSAGVQQS